MRNGFFRRALGPIVFSDPAALTRLNAIVWPEIAKMAREKAASLWKVPQRIKNIILTPSFKEGKKVVVLDAAVLLEADWQHFCHEVRILSINLSLP